MFGWVRIGCIAMQNSKRFDAHAQLKLEIYKCGIVCGITLNLIIHTITDHHHMEIT